MSLDRIPTNTVRTSTYKQMVGKEELLTALKQAKTEVWVSKIRTVFLSSRERTQGTIQAT